VPQGPAPYDSMERTRISCNSFVLDFVIEFLLVPDVLEKYRIKHLKYYQII